NNHRVDAGLLGKDDLPRKQLEVGAKCGASCIVNQFHARILGEYLCNRCIKCVHGKLTCIGIDIVRFKRPAYLRNDNGYWKNCAGVWLHKNSIAGDEASIYPRNGIPDRKRRTSDHKRNSSWHRTPFFVELDV